MSLSTKAANRLKIAAADNTIGAEIASAIDAATADVATVTARVSDNISELGATDDLVGVDGSGDNAAPLAGTEDRLDAIEGKVDALIAALISAGLMAAS